MAEARRCQTGNKGTFPCVEFSKALVRLLGHWQFSRLRYVQIRRIVRLTSSNTTSKLSCRGRHSFLVQKKTNCRCRAFLLPNFPRFIDSFACYHRFALILRRLMSNAGCKLGNKKNQTQKVGFLETQVQDSAVLFIPVVIFRVRIPRA